jgi:hypothetical protein
MHAVVVGVTVNDGEAATRFLREELVPRVSQAPGFVAGYWVTLDGDQGRSTIVFESEDARAVADRLAAPPEGVATIEAPNAFHRRSAKLGSRAPQGP